MYNTSRKEIKYSKLFMKPNQKSIIPVFDSFNDDNIKIFALGGLGEVGKNMYCIECSDELLIIDAGLIFPDTGFGIDYSIPDFTYLENNQNKIKGLFITHGHEDHIGAIPYLLKSVKIENIYANGIAIDLIKSKLKEAKINANIKEYSDNTILNYRNFTVSFFRTNHSIPDSHGIAIKTRLGYILHTGDFKFDFTPLGNNHTEFHKLTSYSQEGVLCLLSDSTNALISKYSESESVISRSIKNIFRSLDGRVIIATFASNIYRIEHIIEASIACNRKILIIGKSMEANVKIAIKSGLINVDAKQFISVNELQYIEPNKVTIITTGSQGEVLAGLSRIATNQHKHVKIIEGDTIIFSSSAIPGNQDSINKIINNLYKQGANVITNTGITDTHTSGHGGQIELQMMLALTKPKYFVPIHGEYTMQKKHCELAIATGVNPENCFILENGKVLTFTDTKTFSLYNVKADTNYIDEHNHYIDSKLLRERRDLSLEGLITIIYTVDKKYNLKSSPNIISRGFIYMKNSEALMQDLKLLCEKKFKSYKENYSTFNEDNFKTSLINELNSYLNLKTERNPIIVPIIMVLS